MAKKFKKHTYWLLRNVFRIVKHFEGTNSGVLNKDTVKRILLVSTTALGDTLFSTPAIRAVRKNYPASHIAVMVHKRTQEILKDNPYCDELIIYKGKYKGLYFLLKTLRRRKFDLAIILHANDPDIVPLIYISGIPCRVGWAESKFAFLLTHTYTRPKSTMHLIPYRLAIAGSVGVCDDGCSMDMFLSDEDKKDIQRYLEKNNITEKKYIGVHPFASHQSKQYDRFPELLNKALRVLDKAIFFVICGKKHASLLEQYEKQINEVGRRVFLIKGEFSIKQTASLIERCGCFISTDSGPLHIALALRVPVVVLSGQSDPQRTGPIGNNEYVLIHKDISCSPCDNRECLDNKCMKEIEPEEIIEAVKKLAYSG